MSDKMHSQGGRVNRGTHVAIIWFAAAVAVGAWATNTYGQTAVTWDGTTGPYTTATNWNPDVVPTNAANEFLTINNGGDGAGRYRRQRRRRAPLPWPSARRYRSSDHQWRNDEPRGDAGRRVRSDPGPDQSSQSVHAERRRNGHRRPERRHRQPYLLRPAPSRPGRASGSATPAWHPATPPTAATPSAALNRRPRSFSTASPAMTGSSSAPASERSARSLKTPLRP